jgi:hypothetical protein
VFLYCQKTTCFTRQIGICWGSAEIASFWEQFAVKILWKEEFRNKKWKIPAGKNTNRPPKNGFLRPDVPDSAGIPPYSQQMPVCSITRATALYAI